MRGVAQRKSGRGGSCALCSVGRGFDPRPLAYHPTRSEAGPILGPAVSALVVAYRPHPYFPSVFSLSRRFSSHATTSAARKMRRVPRM